MISGTNFANNFLNSQTYLARSQLGQDLFAANLGSAGSALNIEPLSTVAQRKDNVTTMLACAASHMGYRLGSLDKVNIYIPMLQSPMTEIGTASAPHLHQTEINLHPFLGKTSMSHEEYRELCDIVGPLKNTFPRELIPKIGPTGELKYQVDIEPWLERVLAAEFAHSIDFLARNRRGELGAAQLFLYLTAPDIRTKFIESGFKAGGYPAFYTSHGLTELADRQMQRLINVPLKDHLSEDMFELIHLYLVAKIIAGQDGSRFDFLGYLKNVVKELSSSFKQLNFLDYALPSITSLGVPDPHTGASSLSDLCRIKMVEWWVNGYLGGDEDLVVYKMINRMLLLSALSSITYRSIPEDSPEYIRATQMGMLIGAAVYLEAYLRMEQGSGGVLVIRSEGEKIEDIGRFAHGKKARDRKWTRTVAFENKTRFADGEVPLGFLFRKGTNVIDGKRLLAWLEGYNGPDNERLTSLKQVIRGGKIKELEEWIDRFRYNNRDLLLLPNPLAGVATTLNDAESPKALEGILSARIEEIIKGLSLALPNREEQITLLRRIAEFSDGGWSSERPDTDKTKILLEIEDIKEKIPEGQDPYTFLGDAQNMIKKWNR